MDSRLFDNLTECSIELAWELVKDDVIMQLVGEEAVPVPYIQESEYYDLYSVIIKEPAGVIDKLRRKERTMWVAGDVYSLSKKDADPPQNIAALINEPEKGTENLNDNFNYHVSDLRNGVRKTVQVTLNHCQRHFVPVLAKHGEIVLDPKAPGLKGIHKVYIIQEVYFITDYTIKVSIDGREETVFSDSRRTPVAFTYKKYGLMSNGMLGTQAMVDVKKGKKAFWVEKRFLRSPNDPLPTAPTGRNPKDVLPAIPGTSNRDGMPLPPVPK